MIRRILLTGAGFSRNWGGWLGAEVTEYLLGFPNLHERARELLWKMRGAGGFEAVLNELDTFGRTGATTMNDQIALHSLQRTLDIMFSEMNAGFHEALDAHSHGRRPVAGLLGSFDAIFTLNQDLLLELHYGAKAGGREWHRPGTHDDTEFKGWSRANLDHLVVDKSQPYIKLHGSSDFRTFPRPSGYPLLVQGGSKQSSIAGHPLLQWYGELFQQYLTPGEADEVRLMVIGYSFADEHINEAIRAAAASGKMRIFVVDPNGADVLEKAGLDRNAGGASRRSLKETFWGLPSVEEAKFDRFIRG